MAYTPLLKPPAGGTGTTTTFTSGSVVFSGASGVYSQDNANLFWDDTNNRLGVRTAAPTYALEVVPPANDGVNAMVFSATAADRPLMTLTRGRGSISAPTALQSGDLIGDFGWAGSTALGTLAGAAKIRSVASEAWTSGALGSDIRFLTVANGTVTPTERLVIGSAGEVAINTSPVPGVTLRVQAAGSNDIGWELQRLTSTNIAMLSYNRASSTYTALSQYASQHVWVTNGGPEAARIDASSNLLIGTTSNPYTSRLNVSGTITHTGTNTYTLPGAGNDYTFTNNDGLGFLFRATSALGSTSNSFRINFDSVSVGGLDGTAAIGTVRGTDRVAGETNQSGGDLHIAGGKSTGSANGGGILFRVSPAGASGTAVNSLSTRLSISTAGSTFIGNLSQNTGAVSLSANAASSITTNSGALTLTGAAASTWSTSSGALTITSAAGATWSTDSGGLTLRGAAGASLITASGGSINVECNTQTLTNSAGGRLTLTAGIGNGTGGGGDVWINAGGSTGSGSVGAIRISNNALGNVFIGGRVGIGGMVDLSNMPTGSVTTYVNPTTTTGGGIRIGNVGNPATWTPVSFDALGASVFTGLLVGQNSDAANNKAVGLYTVDTANPRAGTTTSVSTQWLLGAYDATLGFTVPKASLGHYYVGTSGGGFFRIRVAPAGLGLHSTGGVTIPSCTFDDTGVFYAPFLGATVGRERGSLPDQGLRPYRATTDSEGTMLMGEALMPEYEAVTYDDFNTQSFSTSSQFDLALSSGATATAVALAGAFMVAQLSTGTTAAINAGAAMYYPVSGLQYTGSTVFKCRVNIPTLATVTDDYIFRIGLRNTDLAHFPESDGIYFEYNRSVSTSWRYVTCRNSTRVASTGASPVLVSGAWFNLELVWNSVGAVYFYVDGVLKHTATGASLPVIGDTSGMATGIHKTTATAASRLVYIDYWACSTYDVR